MTMFDSVALEGARARHPDAFRRTAWWRSGAVLGLIGCILYTIYCFWFFSINETLRKGNWDIAGAYMADWVTWEARPDFEIAPDGAIDLVWPRYSPLGDNPDPDWISTESELRARALPDAAPVPAPAPSATAGGSDQGFMGSGGTLGSTTGGTTGGTSTGSVAGPEDPATGTAAEAAAGTPAPRTEMQTVLTRADITMGRAGSVTVLPREVTLVRGRETVVLDIRHGEGVFARGPLPDWAEQREPGAKVVAFFGFPGRVEVEDDAVKVRHRFWGWVNFLFDTRSAFFGKSAGEVWHLLTRGERIDPERSNLALAWSDILNNSEWQHLDVWTKLGQTIVMAFAGTLFAFALAFPLAFLAARNITPSRLVNQIVKRFFDFTRSVDMLIWALFFTRAFGPGPLAGISAIFVTDTGTLGKIYAETLENIDDRQREGVKSVGAGAAEIQRYGVLPQVLPIFASNALYFWESNTRSATIIGAVGAGGIGLKLWEAMRTNQDWENVAYMVLLILIVVYLFDGISNALRSRLIGHQR